MCKKYDNELSKQLFVDTKMLVTHNGFDATRKCGSNEATTYDNYNILSLLKSESAFIRKCKGVKIVKKPHAWE